MRNSEKRKPVVLVQKMFELFPSAGMPQPIERFFLDLPDAFPRHVEPLADFFKGVFRVLAYAEAQPDDFFFPGAQGIEDAGNPVGELLVLHRLLL